MQNPFKYVLVIIFSILGFCTGEIFTLKASGCFTYTCGIHTSTIYGLPASHTTYNPPVKIIMAGSLPTLVISGNNTICTGEAATLSVTGASSYTWSTGSINPIITVTPQTTSVYTVTGSDNGGSNTATIAITVVPLPQVSIAGSTTICAGSLASFTANGAATYSWSTGSLFPTVNVGGNAGTVYSVTGFGTSGCQATATVMISTNPLPVVSIIGDATVCIGSTITQTATGASTYHWFTGEAVASVTFIPLSTSTAYEVTGTDANGCSNTATASILVKPTPELAVNSAVICSGGTAILSVITVYDPTVIYRWFPSASLGYSISVSGIATQVYTVSAIGANGCEAKANSTLTVISPDKPINVFFYDSPVCASNDTIFPHLLGEYSPSGTFFSYDSLNVDAVTGQILTSLLSPGPHVVTYSLMQNGCVLTDTETIVLLSAPNLTVVPNINITPGGTAVLQVSGGNNYSWSPPDYLSCTDCDSPLASPPGNMQYCVASVLNKCPASACVNVMLSCESANDLSVPNAFTPNGDHNNDEFCLQGWSECLTDFHVMIFNRWGEKVFESFNPSFCWDGIYKGKLQDASVFIYVITAKRYQETTPLTKKGNITLIR